MIVQKSLANNFREVNISVKADTFGKLEIIKLAEEHYYANIPKNIDTKWSSHKVKLDSNFPIPFDIKSSLPKIYFHANFYDFNETNSRSIWVVFSNKKVGGGYKNGGWAQEEIIAATFYEMTMGLVKYEKLRSNMMDINECFVWFNLMKQSTAAINSYGKHICDGVYPEEYISLNSTNQLVDFLSIDAPRVKSGNPYTLQQLQHLFIKAYTGFLASFLFGKDIIHTGGWGTGVFGNDPDLIFAIQVLIAKLVGVKEIHFWGQTSRTSLMNDILSFKDDLCFIELFDKIMLLFGYNVSYEDIFCLVMQ